MAVDVHYRRHHGLAAQIDMRARRRDLHFAAAADRREAPVLNDEGRVLDRGAAAGDEPRTFIDCGGLCRRERRPEGRRDAIGT